MPGKADHARRHVLFVHQTYSTANAEGSGRANAISDAMVRAGYRVSIVAGANSYLTGTVDEKYRGRWSMVEEHDGYTIYRPWTYARMHKSFVHRAIYFLVFMCTSVWRILWMPRFDVIVGCSPPITVGVAAAIGAFVRGSRFILEVRDLWPAFPIQMGVLRNRFLVSVSLAVERVLYRRADLVVINSPGFIEHMESRGVTGARLRLNPNGVDLDTFKPVEPDANLRQQLGLDGKFVVLYIGAHGPANALHALLDSAAALLDDENIRILLIGGGKQKPELVERVRRDGLSNVMMLAPQAKDTIPAYIALADLCYASLQNISMFTTTYPNKVFDYLACGKATLTTIDGVSRRVIEDAGAGMYVPLDGRQIAEKIRWAKANTAALQAMGDRGRRAALKEWDRKSFADQFAAMVAQSLT
ncbi:MAG: glycosyltransferase family 4 protein [Cyanobacteria bacterium]|nr:glycosyltransferase family 4 protein [Cyanobacteriota bacterium]